MTKLKTRFLLPATSIFLWLYRSVCDVSFWVWDWRFNFRESGTWEGEKKDRSLPFYDIKLAAMPRRTCDEISSAKKSKKKNIYAAAYNIVDKLDVKSWNIIEWNSS